jgi:hypothetical protein
MREITSHRVNPANDKLTIQVLDEPGAGGACHLYLVSGFNWERNASIEVLRRAIAPVASGVALMFQNGPIAEHGVNGITQEALLAIVVDRLQSFQKGPFSCRENAVALTHLETAQLWLHKRTLDRMARGVEGTHQL